ncbi:MAG: hypothetical protein KF760_23230 [Candidatus Eremiobacteraeota bacterium]|nr:hypothetical protein [Candidatus Eremiobacteraeota bacterium]MCW5870531.1 hypothetical protein [Candidatus Eremiobacteraeota bacterium]
MRPFWLAIALALALPQISPWFWPLILALLYLTRPAVGQLALLVLLCLRLPGAVPTLEGWWERVQSRRRAPVEVYPETLAPDHPQLVTVYAAHSTRLEVHWQGNQLDIPSEPLGHGIFRLRLDPARARPDSRLEIDSDGDGRRQVAFRWLPLQPRPGQLSSLPELGLAATVQESGDQVLLLDRQGRMRPLACGDGPSCCQLLAGGARIVVGTRYSQDLELLDCRSGQVLARIVLGEPVEGMALSPDQQRLAVLCGPWVEIRRLPELALEGRLRLPYPGEYACFAGSSLVVASRQGRSLYRLCRRPSWELESHPRPLARPALGLSRGRDGEVWLASTSAQLHGGHQKGNHYVLNCLLRLNLTDWVLDRPQVTEMRTASQDGPGSVHSGCGPEGLTLDENGDLLLVYSGTHEVARRDLASGEEHRYSLAGEGLLAPRWIADLGQGTWLVSLPAQHTLAWLQGGQVVRKLQLSPITPADEGEIDFYEATLSGVSCQSCHTRGDSDYACHDIGGYQAWGTLSCQGIQNTPPYLRNGSYPRLQDLHTVATGLYRNYRRVAHTDRPQALKAYLETLLLPDNPHPASNQALRRGCEVFFQSGCADCHRPPAFSNRASLPNQDLFPEQPDFEWLDVPSLRGVWRSAPYLHDHRAADLGSLFGRENAADRHGRTGALSEEQKRDLELFLQCL